MKIEDFYIIGSTVVPDAENLPIRLSPIYQLRGQPDGDFFLAAGPERDNPDRWLRESRESVEEEFARGDMVRFKDLMLARKGHVLIQMHSVNHPPEYFPEEELKGRLRDSGERFLYWAAWHAEFVDRKKAAELAWYALRCFSDEENLTALLLVIALERGLKRGRLSEEGLAQLEFEAFGKIRGTEGRVLSLCGQGREQSVRPGLCSACHRRVRERASESGKEYSQATLDLLGELCFGCQEALFAWEGERRREVL